MTLFAVASLVDTVYTAATASEQAFSPKGFATSFFGDICVGLAPWFPGLAVLVGVIPMILALTSGPTGIQVFVIIACLIAVTVKSVHWPLWIMVGAYTAWAIAIGFIVGSNATGWVYGATVLIGLLAGLALRYFVLDRVKTLNDNALLQAALEAEQQRSAERRRQLARELHDGMSHRLAVISGQAMLHRRDDDIEQLRAALLHAEQASRSALGELHSLMGFLRRTPEAGTLFAYDPTTDANNIVSLRLDEVAPQVEVELRAAGFTPVIDINPDSYNLPPTTQTTLSRILQESATNIMRYAKPASACSFTILAVRHEVTVVVTSALAATPTTDTDPVPPANGGGLRGVFERVRLLGGEAHYGPVGEQWRVDVSLPRYV